MTKRVGEINVNVSRIELDEAVSAGISWRTLGPGMVSIYEENVARHEAGILIDDWMAMGRTDKAMTIAIRRIKIASENLNGEAQVKAAKRKANQKR